MASNYWRYVRDISAKTVYPATAVVANKFYVFGGKLTNGQYSKAAYVYDSVLDTWTQLPDMPDVKAYGAAASLDGKILVTGGLRLDQSVSTASYIFDVDTQTWTTGPTCPPIWGHTLVAHPERATFYFFGGMIRTGTGGGTVAGRGVIWEINRPLRAARRGGSDLLSKNVFQAQIGSSVFSLVGTMFSGMAFHASNVMGDTFYHAGGNGGPIPTGIAQKWTIGDTKAQLPAGPVVGNWATTSKYNNVIFFHGGGSIGLDGTINSSASTIGFDTSMNAWSIFPNMQTSRFGAGGGTVESGWQTERTLPYEVRNHGVESINDLVYVFGGDQVSVDGSNKYIFTPTRNAAVYDSANQVMSSLTMPLPITNVQAKAYGSDIIITGVTGTTPVFWRYNPRMDTYQNLTSYGAGMANGGAMVVIDPYVYWYEQGATQTRRYNLLDNTWAVVGGTSGFTGRTDVEAVAVGSLIYYTTHGEMYIFDPNQGTYTPRAVSLLTNPKFKLEYYAGEIHALSQVDGAHWVFNDTTNKWRKLGRNTIPRVNMNFVATSGPLYFIGGHNSVVVAGNTAVTHDARNNESWFGISGTRSIVVAGENAAGNSAVAIYLSSTEVYNANVQLVTRKAYHIINPLAVFFDSVPEYML